MSTNLSSQPRLSGTWGLQPLLACRALLTITEDEDREFVLRYMQKNNPRRMKDLHPEIRALLKEHGVKPPTTNP
ncbi:hypothetical protein KITKAT_18 [Arthrobacter phage Kitkat]|uniref:Uncharacterized protein n=3 Tax=Kelleziovirus TaxID=1982236 RepID=A0A140G6A2_9CAUD|nr:hypothetical protein BJD78_gp17 [Arthrobacter phage KellEzio]YP_009303301.1 hypothetical protein BJD77_gp018 [Arthrobacter phage Kitkat]AMM44187.1 hypothetical protein KELLEZIO_17 [Arthrobacter phage KellEzio]AMM44280.1 hypothetical protein KITKAT_18 [Arthrobacter phage Kitkat]QGJ96456.1 hypothetical protein SEA_BEATUSCOMEDENTI_17 [Arthrobacter phage BeatusComedenti]